MNGTAKITNKTGQFTYNDVNLTVLNETIRIGNEKGTIFTAEEIKLITIGHVNNNNNGLFFTCYWEDRENKGNYIKTNIYFWPKI